MNPKEICALNAVTVQSDRHRFWNARDPGSIPTTGSVSFRGFSLLDLHVAAVLFSVALNFGVSVIILFFFFSSFFSYFSPASLTHVCIFVMRQPGKVKWKGFCTLWVRQPKCYHFFSFQLANPFSFQMANPFSFQLASPVPVGPLRGTSGLVAGFMVGRSRFRFSGPC